MDGIEVAEIIKELVKLLFVFQEKKPAEVSAFVIASLLIGILIVVVDVILYKVSNSSASILKLTHVGKFGTIRNILLWGIGAGIVGYIAAGFDILQVNLQGAMTAGIAWPTILPRLIKFAGGDQDAEEIEQQEVEETVEEEEE